MKKILLMMLCLSSMGCFAQQDIQQVDYSKFFMGYWFFRPTLPPRTITDTFSWGLSETVPNSAYIIDEDKDNVYLFIPGLGGPFLIHSIDPIEDDTYLLSYYFDRGQFQVEQVLHYNKEVDAFWLEASPLLGGPSGPDNVWYRLSGPDKGNIY